MRSKLEVLKKIVEERSGCSLTENTRKREFTYARAVYFKLAREIKDGDFKLSYSKIGKTLNKDHATVMHNINVIFPFAMKDEKYRKIYQELNYCIDDDFSEEQIKIHSDGIKRLYEEIYKRDDKISELMYMNNTLKKFNEFSQGLTTKELEQLYEKMSLTVKVIKNQRGCYA